MASDEEKEGILLEKNLRIDSLCCDSYLVATYCHIVLSHIIIIRPKPSARNHFNCSPSLAQDIHSLFAKVHQSSSRIIYQVLNLQPSTMSLSVSLPFDRLVLHNNPSTRCGRYTGSSWGSHRRGWGNAERENSHSKRRNTEIHSENPSAVDFVFLSVALLHFNGREIRRKDIILSEKHHFLSSLHLNSQFVHKLWRRRMSFVTFQRLLVLCVRRRVITGTLLSSCWTICSRNNYQFIVISLSFENSSVLLQLFTIFSLQFNK